MSVHSFKVIARSQPPHLSVRAVAFLTSIISELHFKPRDQSVRFAIPT